MYKSIGSVEAVVKESAEHQVFILKHSNVCPVSARAKEEVDKFAEGHDVYLVVVQEQRDLSSKLAEKLSVRHESPQFLRIEGGKATKVLNHGDIKNL